ncbi:MAG TPA: hypothetical protein PLT09_09335 [Deltaproteobacteria bacterium]|nr:hypothetical protein [Deltaproteobacteria bacterium]HPR53576.1 hypothetical protein [Deltaproteobacteria bacterium]HXK47633.1 hypothetical protein [Deltaproteobacteria bacterium]
MTGRKSQAYGSSRIRVFSLAFVFVFLIMIWNVHTVEHKSLSLMLGALADILFSEKTLKFGGLLMYGVVALIVCGIMCCLVNDLE